MRPYGRNSRLMVSGIDGSGVAREALRTAQRLTEALNHRGFAGTPYPSASPQPSALTRPAGHSAGLVSSYPLVAAVRDEAVVVLAAGRAAVQVGAQAGDGTVGVNPGEF
jgi:hypothetical protein